MSKKSRKSKYCVSTQVFVSLLALVLVMGVAVGGTIAWLTDTTPEVKNTFTVGDIGITLTETWNTDANNDGTNDSWSAQLIPGFTYKKDPVVAVSADSVDCYLFVKFEENNVWTGSKKLVSYMSNLSVSNGWTQGDGTAIPTNVWYRTVAHSDTTRSWRLIFDDSVLIPDAVTKDDMPVEGATPELIYTAYACQLMKDSYTEFTAAEAWAKVNPTPAN